MIFLFATLAFAAAPAPFALVVATSGLTSLEPSHTNLKVGAALAEGDRVTVMAGSLLRLKLAGGAVVQLGPHSELYLKRNSQGETLLRIPHGDLLLVTKDANPVEVRTAQLKMRVEAKMFFLGEYGEKAAYVSVAQGKAHAKWPIGETDVTSPVLIYPQQSATRPVKAAVSRQTETDLKQLRDFL